MILQTADYGDIEVVKDIWHGFDYRVALDSPRLTELFEEAKRLACKKKVYCITYPYRFMEQEINRKGAKTMSNEAPKITTDMVVEAYVKTREQLSVLKKQYEEEEARLKAIQEKRENWLAAQMDNEGETSKKTPHGTCFFTRKESVTVADWDVLLTYAIENEAYELFERRVSKTAALEIMGADRDQQPPPGTNYVAFRTVNVRKG
jgi:hypothetical protein